MIFGLLHRLVKNRLVRQGAKSLVLELENCSLHYLDSAPEGALRTILLIHGLGTSTSTWVHTFPHLSKSFRTIAVDLPGFGLSEMKDGKRVMTIAEYSEVLRQFIQKVMPDQFTLLGHSLGGWLSMRCALLFPASVQHLVLVNTAGIFYPGAEEQRHMFETESKEDVRTLVDLLWLKYPWYFRPTIGWIHRELRRRHVPEFLRTITIDDFFNPELSHLTMPVSIIWGRQDRMISAEVITILKNHVPDLKVWYVEECGHVPQLEKPNDFLRALSEVLEDRKK